MVTTNINIVPLKGLGNIKFGLTIDQVAHEFGEADVIEQLEDADSETWVLNYHRGNISLFFEGVGITRLVYIESQNKESLLFGEKIFELSKKETLALMAKNGFTKTESDKEEGEERLTFDEAMLDFFFQQGKLIAISWGVFLDENGKIEVIKA